MLRHKRHAESYWETLVLCFLGLLFFLERFEGATTVPAEGMRAYNLPAGPEVILDIN